MKKKFKIIAILTTLAMIAMHIINKIINYMATIDNHLKNTEENYYEWRFGKIHYQKLGSGSPILLIHDLNTYSSAHEWSKVIKYLSKTNTVYAIDLLGCGLSEKPNLTYTSYLYVQLISDFIEHVIGEKSDVVATGSSSSFVLLACANNKDVVGEIILVNPNSIIEMAKIPTKRTKILKFIINMPIVGTLVYNIIGTRNHIANLFITEYFYDPMKVEDSVINTYYESLHIKNGQSKFLFSSIVGRYTNMNILHCLPSINNSIYIITGKSTRDGELIAEQYKNYIPSIEIIPIAKTKHLPQLEYPFALVEQINILFCTEK